MKNFGIIVIAAMVAVSFSDGSVLDNRKFIPANNNSSQLGNALKSIIKLNADLTVSLATNASVEIVSSLIVKLEDQLNIVLNVIAALKVEGTPAANIKIGLIGNIIKVTIASVESAISVCADASLKVKLEVLLEKLIVVKNVCDGDDDEGSTEPY